MTPAPHPTSLTPPHTNPWHQPGWAIIAAGGTGQRFNQKTSLHGVDAKLSGDKLLANLHGKPVLHHTLEAISRVPNIQGILVVCHPHQLSDYTARLPQELNQTPIHFTAGGTTRRESVFRGIQALETLTPQGLTPWILIHDGARPLITPQAIVEAFQPLQTQSQQSAQKPTQQPPQGLVMALPIRDTVKTHTDPVDEADALHTIAHTLDRSPLWTAQTPQMFLTKSLTAAHTEIPQDTPVTDDAQLLEIAGYGPILLHPGNPENIKITTPQDLRLAQAFLTLRASSHTEAAPTKTAHTA